MCSNSNPIFVIGKNRSGTKWLSNILANHHDIGVIQRRGDGGIVETNMFVNYPHLLGPLYNEENFAALKALFLQSNFFRVSGVDKNFVLKENKRDYEEFFRNFMEKYAADQDVNHWLQKANSLVLPKLKRKFPDAKFIIIQRKDFKANVFSSFALEAGKRSFFRVALKEVFLYQLHAKIENKFFNQKHVFELNYENLKKDSTNQVKRLCDFLGLTFEEEILDVKFQPNTSYDKVTKEEVDTNWRRIVIDGLNILFKLIPLSFLTATYKIGSNLNKIKNNKGKFISLTFSRFRDEMDNLTSKKSVNKENI